jgi:hypothetical protein
MKKLLLIAAFLFIGCEPANPVLDKIQEEKLSVEQNIEYFTRFLDHKMVYLKDTQTNLCFAAAGAHSLTNVPCTPEVEKLVTKFTSGAK